MRCKNPSGDEGFGGLGGFQAFWVISITQAIIIRARITDKNKHALVRRSIIAIRGEATILEACKVLETL